MLLAPSPAGWPSEPEAGGRAFPLFSRPCELLAALEHGALQKVCQVKIHVCVQPTLLLGSHGTAPRGSWGRVSCGRSHAHSRHTSPAVTCPGTQALPRPLSLRDPSVTEVLCVGVLADILSSSTWQGHDVGLHSRVAFTEHFRQMAGCAPGLLRERGGSRGPGKREGRAEDGWPAGWQAVRWSEEGKKAHGGRERRV